MDDGLLRSTYALQQSGNLTEAARLYGEIARANPKNFDALCLLGMAQAQLGERENAQRVADEALGIVSHSSRDLYNLGCLLQQLSRHEDALKSYDGALSSRADHFEALIHRGLSLLELKRHEDAVASFETTALKLARDAQVIREVRTRLKANRETHPLFDTVRFTRNLEKAYVEMWARAERGETPEHFAVESVP